MKCRKHLNSLNNLEYIKTLAEEMKLLKKNLLKIMKKGLIIEYQGNGTKKIEFPEPEY